LGVSGVPDAVSFLAGGVPRMANVPPAAADRPSGEVRVLVPCGALGHGVPAESLRLGLGQQPHVIATDAGSSDPGPYYLAAGKHSTSDASYRRDLETCLVAARHQGIPLLVGSAYTAGSSAH